MYRLGELSDRRRIQLGVMLVVLGLIALVISVVTVHIFGLSEELIPTSNFAPLLDSINYGAHKWFKAVGYLVAFGASQALVIGAAFLFVLNQKMTWARAAFAAFLAWMEMVIIFGIVPNEWLNFAQTDLEWSFQQKWFDIPKWLLLNNQVTFSTGALKDAISGAYNTGVLVAAAVFAYKVQDIGKPRPAATKEAPVSPYGRPLKKADS
jgi:hypothetical protein